MPPDKSLGMGAGDRLESQHEKLSAWLNQRGLSAVLVSRRINVRYFSGFAGSAGVLVVTATERKLFVDFRYLEQAEQTAPAFETVRSKGTPLEAAVEYLQSAQYETIGFEDETLTVAEFNKLIERIEAGNWQPVQLDKLRKLKTGAEISLITLAAQIADQAFDKILPFFRPGIAEYELAAALEYEMRKLGSERAAFATIVASGSRSALPHGAASPKLFEPGDLVVVDFGAVFNGYHSDMTRTVCLGRATERQRQIYSIVLEAQLAGLNAVRAGVLCREVDQIARRVIDKAGFAEFFGHGLGHGVGLAIHESPRLSPLAGDTRLEPGMVVTVEPGIYLPDWGGVRIEDLVVVTEQGCQVLSRTGKEFLERRY